MIDNRDGSGVMLPVIYSMSVSLGGFIAGPGDDIGWSAPDPEQFEFHVEQTMSGAAELEFAESQTTLSSRVVYLRYRRTR